jgi:hypothetical protein
MNPNFPVYVVSKGRWESRRTVHGLELIKVPYFIVVEEQEFANYASVIAKTNILVLDKQYQRDYDACDDLGDTKGLGPGPARNFVWDHSIARGFEYHWVMDDNLGVHSAKTGAFYRFNNNLKVPVADGTILRCMEDFVLRYTNVGMAGPNYFMFASRKQKSPPFTLNTRIYSCNLIKNSIPFRWRCRYNEDTDLSLRILKSGLCTVLFNAFLQDKETTQIMGGGNTEEFYSKEGTLPKSSMLVRLHPDVARLARRWGRAHHYVDYSGFKQPLIRKEGATIRSGIDDYGMTMVVDPTVRSRFSNADGQNSGASEGRSSSVDRGRIKPDAGGVAGGMGSG